MAYYNQHDRLKCNNDQKLQEWILDKYANRDWEAGFAQKGLAAFQDFLDAYHRNLK